MSDKKQEKPAAKKSSPKSKRIKVSNSQRDENEALDLSIQKQKSSKQAIYQPSQPLINLKAAKATTIDQDQYWGCLQFYESGVSVYCEFLSGNDPIEINTRRIVQSKALKIEQGDPQEIYNNPIQMYNDLDHILEHGFTLRRKGSGEYSSIEMRCMDLNDKTQPKYKIFVEDKQISIVDPSDIYEIYDGEKILDNKLKEPLGDMKRAYELAHCCHLIIAVYGNYMSSVGPIPLTYESIRREMIPHYPYWFYLKLYPEFYLLDTKAREFITSNYKYD